MRANSIFRDWAGMARLPNVPTVWSNVFTAWVLAGDGWNWRYQYQWGAFVLSVVGGTLMYVGGTILNDVMDVEFDRQHRPERPIPAGRVSAKMASAVGWVLGLSGLMSFVLAGIRGKLEIVVGGTTTIVTEYGSAMYAAFVLWLCILAYIWVHKKYRLLGPVLMGLCRALLGVTAAMTADKHILLVAPWVIVLWAYIVAISVIARGETKPWRRTAVGMMLAALPLVDAVFLAAGGHYAEVLVPVGCMGLAIGLRKVAEAT